MVQMTGAEALTRLLVPEAVPFVFGIAGGKLNPLLHAISREPSIRYLGVRHEACGPLMGAAVAAASGRICVALGEMGPGSSNLVGGLGTAFNNNLPLLLVTSNNHQAASYPNRGMFMDLDTHALLKPLTKWSAVVHDGRRLPDLVRDAFRQALTGRRGPVHLDVPQEIFTSRFDFDEEALSVTPEGYRAVEGPRASAAQIARAAEMLAAAKRPVLVAGGGVVSANGGVLFRELVAEMKAPAFATQMGIGTVPSDSPFFIGHGGIIGGDAIPAAFAEADVVLAVGCRFSSWLWDEGGALAKGDARLININIDAMSLGANAAHALGIWADAKSALADLLAALRGRAMPQRSEWLDRLRGIYAGYRGKLERMAKDDGAIMHPARLGTALGKLLPADALIAYDGGHTSFWSNDLTPATVERTRFHEPGMCQLGFGTPYAVALKLLHPDRPVFNICGDGAFGFTLSELDTARRYGLPIINIIHNNASWGVIKMGQQKSYDFSFGADLDGIDYADVARGFGCHGERVASVDEIGPALERAIASGLPAVIDCHVRFEAHPSMPYFAKMNAYGFQKGAGGGPHAALVKGA
ncbi:acetolactate synthase-1/2/3 large subunit [Neorhizobium sp. 2083]|uniref:thiamine pyrophosphate-binding protein n=1 Tax=Neorhizobium sp. 2083 TaxID=2817762 RepID=UPI0028674ECB|nr:thiamine pyrophosphate-binding protein [Neorhizobium sp. 2083]MDR6820344.1 acetolactate synthase-1/2/3 large subunit [Neorhizobium sp. 2083]